MYTFSESELLEGVLLINVFGPKWQNSALQERCSGLRMFLAAGLPEYWGNSQLSQGIFLFSLNQW